MTRRTFIGCLLSLLIAPVTGVLSKRSNDRVMVRKLAVRDGRLVVNDATGKLQTVVLSKAEYIAMFREWPVDLATEKHLKVIDSIPDDQWNPVFRSRKGDL